MERREEGKVRGSKIQEGKVEGRERCERGEDREREERGEEGYRQQTLKQDGSFPYIQL